MHNDNRDFYDKNGYVILEKIFSDEEAEFFNKCIRRHANKSFAALINPDRYESLLEQASLRQRRLLGDHPNAAYD